MTEQFNYCHVVGQTDVGKKRAANEDNMGNAITINGLVSVVCDGMGGHVGGATASKIAVNTILDNLNTNYYDDPRIAIGESIDIANKAILSEANAHPELSGMGSTCVLLIVRNGKVYIGHVGDSRIYLIRSKKIVQLTKDHSYVQMLVDRGEITREQAERHPRKNEITNALGIPNMTPATVADDAIIPEAGDCFLLCSDGLSGMVSNDVISKVVSRQSEMNAQDRVNRLVALANENGGVDNITAQMVEFPVAPGVIKPEKKFPIWLKILLTSLLVAALGFGAYMLFKEKTPDDSQPESETEVEVQPEDSGKQIATSVTLPNVIPFSKNGELVTIVFSENLVIFKHNEEQISSENDALNASTLTVKSPNIDVSYKSLQSSSVILKFTDKSPGDKVLISIESVDKKKVYQYTINISNSISASPVPKASTKESDDKIGKDSSGQPSKAQTIEVNLDYSELKEGQILLFNYSAKKPRFILNNNNEFEVNAKSIDEVKSNEVEYNETMWKMDFSPKHSQLRFRFKGESSSDSFSFTIPCVLKNTTTDVILKVQLSPKSSDAIDDNMKEETPPENSELFQA